MHHCLFCEEFSFEAFLIKFHRTELSLKFVIHCLLKLLPRDDFATHSTTSERLYLDNSRSTVDICCEDLFKEGKFVLVLLSVGEVTYLFLFFFRATSVCV